MWALLQAAAFNLLDAPQESYFKYDVQIAHKK